MMKTRPTAAMAPPAMNVMSRDGREAWRALVDRGFARSAGRSTCRRNEFLMMSFVCVSDIVPVTAADREPHTTDGGAPVIPTASHGE